MQTQNEFSIFKWEPFTYIYEGFDGQRETVGGFSPSDVRGKCSFCIKQIHVPVVTGFTSWVMYQIINADKG